MVIRKEFKISGIAALSSSMTTSKTLTSGTTATTTTKGTGRSTTVYTPTPPAPKPTVAELQAPVIEGVTIPASLKDLIPFMTGVVSAEDAPAAQALAMLDEAGNPIWSGYSELYIINHDNSLVKAIRRPYGTWLILNVKEIPGVQTPVLETPKLMYMESKQDLVNAFLPAGPIPKFMLNSIEMFFREFCKKGTNLEAQAFILWNPMSGYRIEVPSQRVSGTSVTYDWNFLQDGDLVVVDIH